MVVERLISRSRNQLVDDSNVVLKLTLITELINGGRSSRLSEEGIAICTITAMTLRTKLSSLTESDIVAMKC